MKEIRINTALLTDVAFSLVNHIPLEPIALWDVYEIFGKSQGDVNEESKVLIEELKKIEKSLKTVNFNLAMSIDNISDSFKRQDLLIATLVKGI